MNRTSRSPAIGVFIAAALITLPFPARAADIDAKAKAVMTEAAAFLGNQQTFNLDVLLDYDVTVGTEKEALATTWEIAFKRPGQFSLHLKNEEIEIFFMADEQGLVTYVPEYRQFMFDEGPTDVASVIRRSGFGPLESVTVFLAEIVKAKPFETILDNLSSAAYKGQDTVRGVNCELLEIGYGDYRWEIWIEAGDTPYIRQIIPDVSDMEAEMKAGGVEGSIMVLASLSEWDTKTISDAEFAFDVPKGVSRVAAIRPPPPSQQLLGKPAPDFEIDFLDGGTFDIAKSKGKEIMILDFWATWCGPCRMAMPILERVTKKFADQGVRMYAVNLQEDKDTIRKYLDDEKLGVTVVLDKNGSVGGKYKAESIPQTVIIGKDGTVQVVHVGFSRNLEAQITEELATLVKGELLVDHAS